MSTRISLAISAAMLAVACSGEANMVQPDGAAPEQASETLQLPALAGEAEMPTVRQPAVQPGKYSFLTVETADGGRAEVLLAAIDSRQHRVQTFDYMYGDVTIESDLNGDGTIDAIVSVHGGGNCCPAEFYFVADMKDGKFSVTEIPEVYAWQDPVFETHNGAPLVKFVSVNEGMNTDDFRETTHLFRFEGATPVIASRSVTSEIVALVDMRTNAFTEDGPPRLSLLKDVNGDGRDDEISCAFWERWGRFMDCEVSTGDDASPIEIIGNCKRLGVLASKTGSMSDLVCDADDVVKFDAASGKYGQALP